jgi:hypothetical protein
MDEDRQNPGELKIFNCKQSILHNKKNIHVKKRRQVPAQRNE